MSIVLTNKQEEGLRIAVDRFKHKEPWTCIAGYAGTGKSTLVKFIVEALGLYPNQVGYAAYTGKAAQVLRDKGCTGARTTHKLLYKSYPRDNGTFEHSPRRRLEQPFRLIVIDEVSMLPKPMWDLLMTHRVPVLALGDPFQLQPIGESNHILETPHIFLEEVQRQAQDSEIIRLTMDIRARKPLVEHKGEEVQILPQNALTDGMMTWADQIIVGRNDTRREYNQLMRKYLYDVDTTDPIEGDKLICLRNYWREPNEAGDVMINGSMGTLHNIKYSDKIPFLKPQLIGDFEPEIQDPICDLDQTFRNISMDHKLLTTGVPVVTKKNYKTFPKLFMPKEFDYGYAITCHKSQGSEYNKVLVKEEFLYGSDHARWLYTAATRAKERLVIIKGSD